MDSIIDWGIILEQQKNLPNVNGKKEMMREPACVKRKTGVIRGSWWWLGHAALPPILYYIHLTCSMLQGGVDACNVQWTNRDGRLVSTQALLLTDIFTLHHCCQSAGPHYCSHSNAQRTQIPAQIWAAYKSQATMTQHVIHNLSIEDCSKISKYFGQSCPTEICSHDVGVNLWQCST